jgi:two-component system chemotaxis response regulator CheB
VDRLGNIAAPILVVQHLHEGFSEGLARVLENRAQLPVLAAQDNLDISKGGIFVAPATHHLLVTTDLHIKLSLDPQSVAKPSADVLFSSIARSVGRNGIGVILTGMGRDGSIGLRELRHAGGQTFAQDEATSVVYGMPRAANETGAAEQILPLDEIPAAILHALSEVS